MKCPKCGSENTRVVWTERVGEATRRRRHCECGYRFYTTELPDNSLQSAQNREIAPYLVKFR